MTRHGSNETTGIGDTSTFDAVVIGAGPAGSASAILLAEAGWRVALVERARFPRRKVCGEFVSGTSRPVLRALGLEAAFDREAGPPVRRVVLMAGRHVVAAPMPAGAGLGRALGRDRLDLLLAERAASLGVTLFQPMRATGIETDARGTSTRIRLEGAAGHEASITARVAIAANGSWERSNLPTDLPRRHEARDELGFKAHFRGDRLPAGDMPLLAFPGGYGGMVRVDDGRLSVSCCIRRDALDHIRREGESAGVAVERHLRATTRGIAETLAGAEPAGAWLAAGPIRPGLRPVHADGVFRAGNLAGEAHPVVAEGISMALQSGWLLARVLLEADLDAASGHEAAAERYARAYRRQFAGRIRAAGLFAALARRPSAHRALAPLLVRAPVLLSFGARLSGKARALPETVPYG
ncbi:NAD(P)/FAD-dependent oxidoreductase [Aureimonas jatrophae]|uniref:Dehydrogenase (Flavoprotein) n=1 Tax=Aureimonas jatrophae TaxID=1166073 RepID=A0A1H0K324_9HYPH|nr:FAD-dependent monooxygenase [Aureimonas jatrophae]MBB3950917.1 flavin-dependent dehydrogenase [Aureimonas jatrophae]SDO50153.1 Dehydrogenase (flavoprotein) [Aureimonas jatrophae]